ncbi:hybrid sensor histidine kinase/response regulator [Geomonas subterranea]|uniref:histidine kinase n=1 Tax=Geomonas subterranea TaxID=2847989 RepID=A0ABX8LFM3_9BACT|nr:MULTISPECIES: PAS domain-containing sensor histidine kinase [Geomonas]QXE89018.1 PAS domain S-box protein [Geomonas subterranea]QXM08863.1 PAS domain S-box protein [Geomonas subterranea]
MFDSLEQCRVLFNELPLGMFIQRPDGTPLDVNAAALEMFGMERDQFLLHSTEHPQWHLCTPDGAPLLPEQHPALSALRLGQAARDISLAIHNPRKGSPVPVCMDALPLKVDDETVPSHVCVVFREAREAERALHESESRYRAMVQTQAEFVVRYRRGGLLTFANDTYCRYLQKEREELLGQNFYTFFFLQDREALIRGVESMDGEHQGQALEVRAWLPDGRLVWQKWNSGAIVDGDGQVVEYQATGMDITRGKQAEEGLKKSEERYRSLFDNMLNGFAYCRMILDSSHPQDFVFLEVNQSFERLTGLRGASGKRMSDVLPGVWKSDPELLASFRRVALSGKPEQMEYYVNAISEWLSVSVYSPEPGCFVIVFDVITKRKRTEECLAFLAQSNATAAPDEQFFHRLARYLAGTLNMDFICIDQLEEGNLWARTVAVYYKGIFEENVRYALKDTPCGEVVGRNICCYREGVRQLFPNDQVLQDLKAESYLGVVLWGSTGVPIGLIAVIGCNPLLNRELAEEILQMVSGRAAAELERRLHEEERLRLEQQLLHAQKLESLGILAGGIAHDFNNILTGILGNSSLGLMRIAPDSPAVENLQNIEKGAIRAADLARQMLAYSGKGMFVVEPVSLNSLLTEMVHLLEVSVSKKCRLVLELAEELPPVQADSTQLRQIVMNLVINASEAIGDRGGTITIRSGYRHFDHQFLKSAWSERELAEGDFLFLQVEDDGCGMDEATLARIFDPFFTTKFTGRGLGMSAVLGIIRGHRGAIKVESRPGHGTTFTVVLPASELPVQDQVALQQPEEAWQGSGTVLLVDDEEIICEVGASMLEQLGYEVVTALSGSRAVELYRERGDVRFVILDLTMPQMDGEQTFQELRRFDPEVKVIISSGYSEQEVTRKLSGTGYLAFIQKPYSIQALSDVMKRSDTRRRGPKR